MSVDTAGGEHLHIGFHGVDTRGEPTDARGIAIAVRGEHWRGLENRTVSADEVAQTHHVGVAFGERYGGMDGEQLVGFAVGLAVGFGPQRHARTGARVDEDHRGSGGERCFEVGPRREVRCLRVEPRHMREDGCVGAEPVVAVPLGNVDGDAAHVGGSRPCGERHALAGVGGGVVHHEGVARVGQQTVAHVERITARGHARELRLDGRHLSGVGCGGGSGRGGRSGGDGRSGGGRSGDRCTAATAAGARGRRCDHEQPSGETSHHVPLDQVRVPLWHASWAETRMT